MPVSREGGGVVIKRLLSLILDPATTSPMRLKYGEPPAYTPLVATFPCAMPSQVIALIAEYAYRSYICKKAMLTSKAGKTYFEKCKRQIAVEEVRAASVLTQFSGRAFAYSCAFDNATLHSAIR